MSVVVTNLNMPKGCGDCWFLQFGSGPARDYSRYCSLANESMEINKTNFRTERLPNCPLRDCPFDIDSKNGE